jgi:thioredoxin reductase
VRRKQVVIVGAGPAGLAAAEAAARSGASVVVLDERPESGGQLLYRAQSLVAAEGASAERPEHIIQRLLTAALAAGAEVHTNALVAAAFAGNELLVIEHEQARGISADAIVIATGSTDLPYPFAGCTLPGIFSARGLQILMNQWRVRPGRRFAVIGSGAMAEELAIDILLAGGEVAWSGIAPGPFLRVSGDVGVQALMVGPEIIDVDVVAIAVGRQPDSGLATMAGAPVAFSAALGGLVPVVDERMQTPQPGLFVAGDAAGAGNIAAAIAEGRLAGIAAAASIGLAIDAEVDEAREQGGAEIAWRIAERASLGMAFSQPFE